MEIRDPLPMPSTDEAYRWVFSRIASPTVAAELTAAMRMEAEPFRGIPDPLRIVVPRDVCLGVSEWLKKTGSGYKRTETWVRFATSPYWTPHPATWYCFTYRGRLLFLTLSLPNDPSDVSGCRLGLRDFGGHYSRFESHVRNIGDLVQAKLRHELQSVREELIYLPSTFDPDWKPAPVPLWRRIREQLGATLFQRARS